MKLIESSVEIIPQAPGVLGAMKQIEIGARNCYKSENLITDDSYKKMLDILDQRKHYSPFEHGTVYLVLSWDKCPQNFMAIRERYKNNHFSEVIDAHDEKSFIQMSFVTTNMRVIKENGWEDDLRYWSEPQAPHVKRMTVRFIGARGIIDEFMRHRMAISCESTRYVNYSKDKFGNEITFVKPYWLTDDVPFARRANYITALENAEYSYMVLLKDGLKPQEARDVLPLGIKAEVVMTGTTAQWDNFLKLRTGEGAHPDAKILANKLKNLLNETV